ncbi:MAG: nucleoside monophosphate kinase [Patescibacteria group bacterium]
MTEVRKMAIILIGPPGSGKGTQAELLAKELGFYHFEISKVIEEKFKNAEPNDPEIAEQKKLWLGGGLMTPAVIIRWFREEVGKLKDRVKGFVFSGSARTLEETEKNLEFLAGIYGKDEIAAVEIKLSEAESIKRNSARRLCQANRHPIPNFPEFANISVCPEDGSPIVTRPLDKPEIIKERYQVYLRDTAPVLQYFRDNGYRVIEINGEQPIEKVFADIKQALAVN